MPQAETTSADEEIETIARLVQEIHQCADDLEVITVKPIGVRPPQSLGNSDFLGSKRKFGQSQFLKTFPCFLLLLLF